MPKLGRYLSVKASMTNLDLYMILTSLSSSPPPFAGLRLCGNRRANYYLHLAWGIIYAVAGLTQFVAGIYFMMELPIFQLGSNIWTGAWVSGIKKGTFQRYFYFGIYFQSVLVFLYICLQNVFSAVITILICCSGSLSILKAQGLLLMSLVVIVVNLINLVILEVGEWRGFLSDKDRAYIQERGMDGLMYDGELIRQIINVYISSGMQK